MFKPAATMPSISLLLISSSSAAQSRSTDALTSHRGDNDDGYSVIFKDDPLQGLSQGATGAVIRIRPRTPRTMLLRPRLQFVKQMLWSLEGL